MRLISGVLTFLSVGVLPLFAQPAPTPSPDEQGAASPWTQESETAAEEIDTEAIYETGKALWESVVPQGIRSQYEFPSKADWEALFARLQTSLDQESFAEVARLEPEVQRAVSSLREVPLYPEYLDWLEERLDFVEVARLIAQGEMPMPPPRTPPGPTPTPTPPGVEPPALPGLPPTFPPSPPTPSPTPRPTPTPSAGLGQLDSIPHYPLWLNRLRERPQPRRAAQLMPQLKAIFAAEGVPSALAWIAEVESSLNPEAKSPVGAYGLFQLMPTTAQSLGLSTFPIDERAHPTKSAQAAAKHLKALHTRFGNWPLALAAYNAGGGRISRALKKHGPGAAFADIAPSLSVETRMYVPKVLATINLREGVSLARTVPGRPSGWSPRLSFLHRRPATTPLGSLHGLF